MKRFIALALSTILMLAVFTGCETRSDNYVEKTPYNLILIAGMHCNAKTPDFDLISEELLNAVSNAATVTIIVNDGNPYVFDTVSIPEISSKLSQSNQEKKRNAYARHLKEIFKNASAKCAEVDIYSSIALAARCVTDSSDVVVMLDSGLSTTGRINFTKTTISRIDTAAFTETILNGKYMLDMHGATVELYGLGETIGRQPNLSVSDYNSLVSFYQFFFSSVNAKTNIHTQPYGTSEGVNSDYDVSICPVSSDVCKIPTTPDAYTDDKAAEDNTPVMEETTPIVDGVVIDIPTTAVGFLPDSADLISPTTAVEALGDLSKTLKASDDDIVLVGMTATSGNADSAKKLSVERANTVMTLLNELGVNTIQYVAVGTGYDPNPFRVNDLDSNGHLIEEKARQNRTVLLMTKKTALNAGLI